jgi:hypothetical protein
MIIKYIDTYLYLLKIRHFVSSKLTSSESISRDIRQLHLLRQNPDQRQFVNGVKVEAQSKSIHSLMWTKLNAIWLSVV